MKKILLVLAIMAGIAGGCDSESSIPLIGATYNMEIKFIECTTGDAECSPDGAVFNCQDERWVATDLCTPSKGYECTTDAVRCGTDPDNPAACCARIF